MTPDAIARARSGAPWALSGLLHGIDDLLDDEGRPLGERRASSSAKAGVEIELKACPYPDLRRDRPMNLSAFRQVMEHLQETLTAIAAFQAALPHEHQGFWRILVSVIDPLSQPAAHLLETNDLGRPLPAPIAVGYKLAAGFFSAANEQIAEPSSKSPAAYARALLDHVTEHRLLVGASEVCAGPANLIEKAALAFATPNEGATPCDPGRVTRAVRLGAQLRLGLFLRMHDLATESWLLCAIPPEHLRPRNAYLERALLSRREELREEPCPRPTLGSLLPAHVMPDIIFDLRESLSDRAIDRAAKQWLGALSAALGHEEDAALRLTDDLRAPFLEELVHHLALRSAVLGAQFRLEMDIRATFDQELGQGFAPNGLVLPRGGAQRWLEALLGHRIEMEPGPKPAIKLRNHHRTFHLSAPTAAAL